jgi:hypothetical protein
MTILCLTAMLSERAKSRFICVQSSVSGESLSYNEIVQHLQYAKGTTAYENWRAHFMNNPHELQP